MSVRVKFKGKVSFNPILDRHNIDADISQSSMHIKVLTFWLQSMVDVVKLFFFFLLILPTLK